MTYPNPGLRRKALDRLASKGRLWVTVLVNRTHYRRMPPMQIAWLLSRRAI